MRQPRLLLSDAVIADILEQAEWYSVQSGEGLSSPLGKGRDVIHVAYRQSARNGSAVHLQVRRTPGREADNDSRIS